MLYDCIEGLSGNGTGTMQVLLHFQNSGSDLIEGRRHHIVRCKLQLFRSRTSAENHGHSTSGACYSPLPNKVVTAMPAWGGLNGPACSTHRIAFEHSHTIVSHSCWHGGQLQNLQQRSLDLFIFTKLRISRNWIYGLNFYSERPLPPCSSGKFPVRLVPGEARRPVIVF